MTRAISVAALAALHLSPASQADLVYQTRYERQSDGTLVAQTLPDAESYRDHLELVFGLYAPFQNDRKKLAEAMEQQRKHELTPTNGQDDAGNFGEIGDTVNFNPLATGGTVDIATGGDYIDTISPDHFVEMEIKRAGSDGPVFRQQYGQVQGHRHTLRGTDTTTFTLVWLAELPWDTDLLNTDASGLTDLLEIRLAVVPAPGASALALAGLVLVSSRRQRREHAH